MRRVTMRSRRLPISQADDFLRFSKIQYGVNRHTYRVIDCVTLR